MPPAARAVLAAIVAFLVGFGWQYVRARGLERRLDATTRELQLARLEASLAVAITAAQRGEYERARQQASAFYTDAQRTVTSAKASARRNAALPPAEEALQGLLRGRDALVTLLARDNPDAADALARQLAEYRAALHGPPTSDRGGAATGPAARSP